MGWGRPPLPGLDTPTPPTPARAVALRSGGAGARHLEPRTGRPGVSARPTAREDRDRRRAGAGGPSASPGVRGWRPRGGGGRSRAPHAPRRPRSAPPLAEPVRGSQPPGALVGCGRLTLLCAPWAAGGGATGADETLGGCGWSRGRSDTPGRDREPDLGALGGRGEPG